MFTVELTASEFGVAGQYLPVLQVEDTVTTCGHTTADPTSPVMVGGPSKHSTHTLCPSCFSDLPIYGRVMHTSAQVQQGGYLPGRGMWAARVESTHRESAWSYAS